MTAIAAFQQEIRHATTLAVAGRAVMLIGPSGCGKSAVGLEMMALGAALVADDMTRLTRAEAGDPVIADAPPTLPEAIEARGLALCPATLSGPTPLVAIVDLGTPEVERLPLERHQTVLGVPIRCLNRPRTAIAAALMLVIPTLDGRA